ncbi:MAG: hypothetical protein ABIT01_13670, partial [Thermoanaerobaculia bacterium]
MRIRSNHFRDATLAAGALGLALSAHAADPKGSSVPPSSGPQASARTAPVVVIVREAKTGR